MIQKIPNATVLTPHLWLDRLRCLCWTSYGNGGPVDEGDIQEEIQELPLTNEQHCPPQRGGLSFAAQTGLVFLVALLAAIFMEVKNPTKENTQTDVAIFGFAAVVLGQLRAATAAKEAKYAAELAKHEAYTVRQLTVRLTSGQNKQLNKIENKVNGGTEKQIAAVKESYEEKIQLLQKEHERERHYLKGQLGARELEKTLAEKDTHHALEVAALVSAVKEGKAANDVPPVTTQPQPPITP